MLSHAPRKYVLLARVSLNSKLAYPLDVLVRTFFFATVLFIFSRLWQVLLGSSGQAQGFAASQLVWYLAVTEVIMMSNSRIDRRIEDDVKSGAVAYTLIRPLHFVWYYFAVYVGETMALFLFNAAVGSLVALWLAGGPGVLPALVPVIALSLALAFVLNFFIRMSLALLAFWVEDTAPFFWIYSKFLFTLGGLFIPLEFYPGWLQNFSAALPFNFILYRPARFFVAGAWDQAAPLLSGQLFWIGVLLGICMLMYGRGVQKISVNGG